MKNDFIEKIKSCNEYIKKTFVEKDSSSVLICGDTGAGKSTIMNILLDNHSMIVKQKENTDLYAIDLNNNTKNAYPKIGVNNMSTTTEPIPYPIQKTIYWDCPGFEDTNGAEQQLINAYGITQTIQKTNQFKILCVIEESGVLVKKGEQLRDLVFKINKMFIKEDLYNNVVFCFTKVKEITNYEKFILDLIKQMNKMDDFNALFLTQIIEKQNFLLFEEPIKEGIFDSNSIQQKILEKIIRIDFFKTDKIIPVVSYKTEREFKNNILPKCIEHYKDIFDNFYNDLSKNITKINNSKKIKSLENFKYLFNAENLNLRNILPLYEFLNLDHKVKYKIDDLLFLTESIFNTLGQNILKEAQNYDLIEKNYNIIKDNYSKIYKLLDDKTAHIVTYSSCSNHCNIFFVNDIVYDNKLLNDKKLLQYLVNNKVTLNQIFESYNKLDNDFITSSLENKDYEAILAGLMSIETNT